MNWEQGVLETTASRGQPRISVRAIVLSKRRVLVQRGRALCEKPGDPDTCYGFIGGGYEVGDTFASRLEREFEQETTAKVVRCQYLFVVENRTRVGGKLLQSVDHYFEVTLDREDVQSKESHLSQYWLPVSTLKDYDLRPCIVRDVIAEGRLYSVRHLVVPLDGG